MMNFLIRTLSGEGENNPSSKRLITFLAFLLLAMGFIAELFFQRTVTPAMLEAVMYVVLGGLGFTASEKFVAKREK
jgi:hypothetical protein